jgi:DnaK suppressor protein
MTKTELNRFRRELEDQQTELGHGSRDREALAIETSPDDLDRIQHASERDAAMRDLERKSNRLREVQTALRRADAGTYGICTGCEETINLKRLAAVPWAALCIVCQEAADQERKTSWEEIDPSLMAA